MGFDEPLAAGAEIRFRARGPDTVGPVVASTAAEAAPALPRAGGPRVAIVHYWLVGMRGGEKVIEEICALYPDADIFTLVADPDNLSPRLRQHRITTSFLQRIGGRKHYQKMLPLMPFALEAFDLTAYDLVISSEAGPAKGVITRPDALHVCYCHSPMRYIWDLQPQYMQSSGRLTRAMLALFGPPLRQWDVTTAARVDHFIANSAYVAQRIRKFYRREAAIIHPPVDLGRFVPAAEPGEAYLCAGQITPYKKIEIAVAAFTRMGKRLDIIGSGATIRLREMAGPTVRFLGAVDDRTMSDAFARCRALIFPGVEDFGIVPLEVMASGRPVIAFRRGGATETVLEGRTGLFFDEQTPESLIAAVERFEAEGVQGTPEDFAAHVRSFGADAFRSRFRAAIEGYQAGVAPI